MKRAGGPRPGGTDGSDFAFRMTVDDRYKKAAHGRVQMRRFLAIQAAFLILRAVWMILALVQGEPGESTTIAACVFGGCAVLIGTFSLKSTRSHLLKFYLLLTGICLALSLVPLVTGEFFTKFSSELESQKSNYLNLAQIILQGLEQLSGIMVHLLAISTAFKFSKLITR